MCEFKENLPIFLPVIFWLKTQVLPMKSTPTLKINRNTHSSNVVEFFADVNAICQACATAKSSQLVVYPGVRRSCFRLQVRWIVISKYQK